MADDLAALIDTLTLDPDGRTRRTRGPIAEPRTVKRGKGKRDLKAKVRREVPLAAPRKPIGTAAYDAVRDAGRSLGIRGSDMQGATDAFEFMTGFGELGDSVDRGLTGQARDGDAETLAVNGVMLGLGGPLAKLGGKAVNSRLGRKAVNSRLGRWLTQTAPLPEARPAYVRDTSSGNLVVRRRDLQPETVPEAKDAKSLGELRTLIRDYKSNPARRMVDEASMEARGVPYDPALKPKSSLARQAGMGRAYKEAVSGNPAYDHAVFERYGEMMPEVVEKAKAQNYDQLREAAYLELSDEVKRQFDRLPVQTTYHDGALEYPVPSAMMKDALGEGNLNVFQGGDPHEFLDRMDRPAVDRVDGVPPE